MILFQNFPNEVEVDEEQSEYDHLKRLTIVHPRTRESVRASLCASGLYDHIFDEYGGEF